MRISIFLFLLIIAFDSNALVLNVAHFKKHSSEEAVAWYVKGAADALILANEELINKKAHPLFCNPGNLSLNVGNYLQMINTGIQRNNPSSNTVISKVLLSEMIRVFPCK